MRSTARLPDAGAEAIIGPNPNVLIAGSPYTPLRGIPVAGGYRVTGRVSFVSNCHNAAWLAVNAQIVEAPHPPRGSTGPPATVRVLIPMAVRAEQATKYEQLAEQLALHAQTEEEVLFPAAVLVGDIIRARRQSK
jgi:hypothetical protein